MDGQKGTNMENAPKVWKPECKYCETMSKWGSDHESEILDRARKFCPNPHFTDFVYSELDWLDHAQATPFNQTQLLTRIHDKMDCHCQDRLIALINGKVLPSKIIDARSLDLLVTHTVAHSDCEALPSLTTALTPIVALRPTETSQTPSRVSPLMMPRRKINHTASPKVHRATTSMPTA